MSTVSRTRMAAKPRTLPQRRVRWLQRPERTFDDYGCIELTVGKEVTPYLIRRIATDFGLAGFQLLKLDAAMRETSDQYHILLHGDLSRCDCIGWEAHGNCKHLDAVLALMRANPFEDAVTVPAPRPSDAELARAVRDCPPYWHPAIEQLDDGSWTLAARWHWDYSQVVTAASAEDLVAAMRAADQARDDAKRKPVPPTRPNPPPPAWQLSQPSRLSDGSEMVHITLNAAAGGRLHRKLGSTEWTVYVGYGPETKTLGTVTDPANAIERFSDRFQAWLPRGRRESNWTGD